VNIEIPILFYVGGVFEDLIKFLWERNGSAGEHPGLKSVRVD